jgi:hypothetical protein
MLIAVLQVSMIPVSAPVTILLKSSVSPKKKTFQLATARAINMKADQILLKAMN